MSGRRPLVAGNWKMHKTGAEARDHIARLRALLAEAPPYAEVAVCPPFTALEAAATEAEGSPVRVLAQAVHEAPSGAHTGEISAPMILATGAVGTLVGHSERRAAGETDDQVAARVRAALDAGLQVIACVGESLEQREAGETESLARRPGAGRPGERRAGRRRRARDRLRADLGDRHRAHRDPRDGPGRLRPRPRGGRRRRSTRAPCGCSTAAASPPRTRPA